MLFFYSVCWLVLCSILLVIYGLLSFRALGLHIRGVEENSRSKRDGIFQDDECIVKINDAELMDKSFSQWVSELNPSALPSGLLLCLHLLIAFASCCVTQFLDLSSPCHGCKNKHGVHCCALFMAIDSGLVSKAEKHSTHGVRAHLAVMVICWALFAVCSRSPPLELHYCTLSCLLDICYPKLKPSGPNKLVLGQFVTYNVKFASVSLKFVTYLTSFTN